MQANDFLKEKVSNMNSIVTLMTRNKMCHIRKMINHHKNTISPPLSPWQTQHKIHRYISPRSRRNRKRHIQTMWVQPLLSFLTCGALSHVPLHITPHPRPKEVCGQHLLRLLGTKMSHQSASMCLYGVYDLGYPW